MYNKEQLEAMEPMFLLKRLKAWEDTQQDLLVNV